MATPLKRVMQTHGMMVILVDLADPASVVAAEALHQTKMGNSRDNCESPIRGRA